MLNNVWLSTFAVNVPAEEPSIDTPPEPKLIFSVVFTKPNEPVEVAEPLIVSPKNSWTSSAVSPNIVLPLLKDWV